jgi:hypothetical protein
LVDPNAAFHVTRFEDRFARTLTTKSATLDELREWAAKTNAADKGKLPLLKCAIFGDERTKPGSLRHDANVMKITGAEVDYDGEKIPFEDAVATIARARLKALLYTSPSHTAAKPRWRVILPASQPLPPTERKKLVARVNGLFDGQLGNESFTLSQSYYFGSVNGSLDHRTAVVEGNFIDNRADLDDRAIWGQESKAQPDDGGDPTDWEELFRNVQAGDNLHDSVLRLAAKLTRAGADDGATVNLLRGVMKAAPLEHDERWRQRYNDIPRTVRSAREKLDVPEGLGEWDAGDVTEPPPPRGWLLGNIFARKFMSSLVGDGAVGKTALRYAQLLSAVTHRELTGEHVFCRCRVLIISLEDDRDELQRRLLAPMLRYGIKRSDLKGWLFLSAPGGACGRLMTADKKGYTKVGPLRDLIEKAIVAHNIDIVSIDPFIKSHGVDENSNTMIDEVVQVLTDMAAKYNIAVDAPHHTSKGASDPGNANRGRGASAMKDAARLVYTLTPMTEDEARKFDIPEEERKLYVRMDSGKVNIAPPMGKAKWFKLVGVSLNNGTPQYPSGDEVQTIERWRPPVAWDDLDDSVLNRILTAIDAGLKDGSRYSDSARAGGRAAWKVVLENTTTKKTEAQAKEIIHTWVKNGVLERKDYRDPSDRKERVGLFLNPEKRPGGGCF